MFYDDKHMIDIALKHRFHAIIFRIPYKCGNALIGYFSFVLSHPYYKYICISSLTSAFLQKQLNSKESDELGQYVYAKK